MTDCVTSPRISIEVETTGNYTDRILYLYDQIPALWTMLTPRFRRDDIIHQTWYDGLRNPERGVWEHVMIFQYVDMRNANESHEQNASTQETTISIGILYMENAPEYNLTMSEIDSQDWIFGIGRASQAYYSKVECDIRRNRPEDNNLWEAYPQIRTNCNLAREMDAYWSVTAIVPADGSGEKFAINMPSSEDLLRFYQSYMIAKDTYYPLPSTKQTSVRLSTVELSIAFIVVCGLILLVVIYGLLHWVLMRWKYRESLQSIPGTKVDWVLQSIQESRTVSTTQVESQNQLETRIFPLAQVLESRRELWLGANYTAKQNAIAEAFGRVYSANPTSVNEKTPNTEAVDQGAQNTELSISASQAEQPGPGGTSSHPPSEERQQPSKSKPAVSVSIPDI
ncbi:hypothetical protein LTR84_000646 [Exophiala bonariae]|uniref:Uncharacterized protein n=1 Tax=Exophiala bonariae TaxID=1690606 RepID=A0AAV9NRH3_9EURO|nr:hypothetical protein LTR84_000646 [Exophiala bonariae]